MKNKIMIFVALIGILFCGAIWRSNDSKRVVINKVDLGVAIQTGEILSGVQGVPLLPRKIIKGDNYIKEVSDEKVRALEYTVLESGDRVVKKNGLGYSNHSINSESLQEITDNKESFIKIGNLLEVSPRIIASVCFAEHLRQRDSYRARMRGMVDAIGATQFLSRTKLHSFSQGLCSIKPVTAAEIEGYIKNPKSKYYLGKKYEKILEYKEKGYEINKLVKERLIDDEWNILYAGIVLKMVDEERERAGYEIKNKPGILPTLYNLGFYKSKPKKNPKAGGADIVLQYKENDKIKRQQFWYGELAESFFFSKIFPEIIKTYTVIDKKKTLIEQGMRSVIQKKSKIHKK